VQSRRDELVRAGDVGAKQGHCLLHVARDHGSQQLLVLVVLAARGLAVAGRRDLAAPVGGIKRNGIGREGGDWSFEFFCDVKDVVLPSQDLDYIDVARSEGAHLAFGGEALDEVAGQPGFYLRPALFTQTDNRMRINREEIFGPVAAVIRVRNADEALVKRPWSSMVGRATGLGITSAGVD
jgi:acyl-CoA reductase-like NAD-dependent aldehyde dehydrogenase